MAARRYRKRILKSCMFCIPASAVYMKIIRDDPDRCIRIFNKFSGKLQILQCIHRHIFLHDPSMVNPGILQILCHRICFCDFFTFPLSAGDDHMHIRMFCQIG